MKETSGPSQTEMEDVTTPNEAATPTVTVSEERETFKKPVLIGPRPGKTGKLHVVQKDKRTEPSIGEDNTGCSTEVKDDGNVSEGDTKCSVKVSKKGFSKFSPAEQIKDALVPLPYKEPQWSGIASDDYNFEVLKSGTIIDSIKLNTKSFYVFGRLSTCDVRLEHPSISRYHAVLQYCSKEENDRIPGFYIYDLSSTHGTFLNKNQIKANVFVRVRVGHVVKFGGSTRMFILQGPDTDQEEESEFTVTELKQRRQEAEEKKRQLEIKKMKEQEETEKEQTRKEEDEGIDWGMGEDADEETDLTENPFASTQNEELFINDPKKTLRGWFEREGYELEYDVEEKGFGQFSCKVELPIDNSRGEPIVAESFVKGKKKEAVVQCALEACRILDRHGMLRQSTHESRKKKQKNWEDDDFYDSDEDTFLDRTGLVEKKRAQRMKAAGKLESKVETYETLLEQHSEIEHKLRSIEEELQNVTAAMKSSEECDEDEDALDAFMTNLKSGLPDKKVQSKLKADIAWLRQEEARLRKLVNISRPATLPELTQSQPAKKAESSAIKTSHSVGPLRNSNKYKKLLQSSVAQKSTPVNTQGESSERTVKEMNKQETSGDSPTKHSGDDQRTGKLKSATSHESVESECSGSGTSESKVKGPYIPTDMLNKLKEQKQEASSAENKGKRKRTEGHDKRKSTKNDYDASDPDYSVWVPPADQSGDGRTKLNEKYGY